MRFLDSYMSYQPVTEPEKFDVCLILLTQPALDRWAPQPLSELFLDRIKQVSVKKTVLNNAGHYPIEQPGLNQLQAEVHDFIKLCCGLSS